MGKRSVQSVRENADSRTQTLCSWLREDARGVILSIHARPGAKKDAIAGLFDGRLKVSLAAAPVEGKANARLCAYFARELDVPKSAISILTGETGREKRVLIAGVSPDLVLNRLQPPEISG